MWLKKRINKGIGHNIFKNLATLVRASNVWSQNIFLIWQPWRALHMFVLAVLPAPNSGSRDQEPPPLFGRSECRKIYSKYRTTGTWDQRYDFLNIFAEKFGEKICVYDSKQS
jgi:hypothetical protein